MFAPSAPPCSSDGSNQKGTYLCSGVLLRAKDVSLKPSKMDMPYSSASAYYKGCVPSLFKKGHILYPSGLATCKDVSLHFSKRDISYTSAALLPAKMCPFTLNLRTDVPVDSQHGSAYHDRSASELGYFELGHFCLLGIDIVQNNLPQGLQ